ncbi:MAG: bifunctional oligoribonuclease/PAP phosphatase NrnA [Clostridia bacterium]|nr:bifunctional oligoribonuclease/PAP phosphatase NrnA [Clostridia bacterium]
MTITEIASKIKGLKSALIFSHVRPDGDTIGSATALRNALISLGINADLVCDSPIPEKFSFIDGVGCYVTPDKITKEYDGYIAVDCSVSSMFGGAYSLFIKNKNTFNIDHHVSNAKYAKYNYVFDNSSNCENVYELLGALNVDITEDIANSLLLGIVTDTGNFAHSNTTAKTLANASDLVSKDANLNYIIYKMFKEQSKARAKLYARVISNATYYLEDRVGVLVINKSDLEEFGAVENMTEGFIDFPMTVIGVEVAISLLEVGDKRYKISLRSKGKVNVNEIASLYGGGGHILASGAMLNGYKEDIIDKLVYNVSQRLE